MDSLQTKIKEVLPKEKEETPYHNARSIEYGQDRGYNQALLDVHSSIPKIIEIIEKKLMRCFDELESNDIDKSMEQWKNYKFIRNNIRDILTK